MDNTKLQLFIEFITRLPTPVAFLYGLLDNSVWVVNSGMNWIDVGNTVSVAQEFIDGGISHELLSIVANHDPKSSGFDASVYHLMETMFDEFCDEKAVKA